MISSVFAASWEPSVPYTAGDIVEFNGQYYEVVQSHTSQAGWTPLVVPSLFVLTEAPAGSGYNETTPVWAGQSVTRGDIVEYNGISYRVIQSHVTQDDWTPDRVPALFIKEVKHETSTTVNSSEYTLTEESVKPIFDGVERNERGYTYIFSYIQPEYQNDLITLNKRTARYDITFNDIQSCSGYGLTNQECYDHLVLGTYSGEKYYTFNSVKSQIQSLYTKVYQQSLASQQAADSIFMNGVIQVD